MKRCATRQRGFALIIVLWWLALLALLGVRMMADAREDTQRARSLLDAAMLEAAANGAVQQAIYATLDTSGQHWAADGLVHTIRSARALISVRIESEADKINPNTASRELLVALLRAVGAPPATAATVADSIVE